MAQQPGHQEKARPVTYWQATGNGRTWLDARDRYDELTQRDLHARSVTTLKDGGCTTLRSTVPMTLSR